MSVYRLIGGVRDGGWVNLRDGEDSVVLPAWPDRSIAPPVPPYNQPIMPSEIRLTRYRRMTFRGLRRNYSVFVEPRMSPDEVLEKLIERYEP